VAQLNRAGFQASAGAKACEASVYGEIIALKGKDRVEAEVEFRLLLSGDQTPSMSSIGKGKSVAPGAAPGKDVIMAMTPGKLPVGAKTTDHASVSREAVVSAFADVAKQIEEQRPSRSTRAAAE
jgi:hypothetical protein